MKYVFQRERDGYIEYLDYIYSEEYDFKVKVTTDIREAKPVSRGLADMTLKLLVHTGEYFELKEVAE